MKTSSSSRILLFLAILSIMTLSCKLVMGDTDDEAAAPLITIDEAEPVTNDSQADTIELDKPEPVEDPIQEVIRQWASSATASTEYDSPGYAAEQATGAPDTPDCGDHETAWASEEGLTIDWLEIQYDTPVIPIEINIYESHTPTQVSLVELVDTSGFYHEVYSAVPEMQGDCPYILSVQVEPPRLLSPGSQDHHRPDCHRSSLG